MSGAIPPLLHDVVLSYSTGTSLPFTFTRWIQSWYWNRSFIGFNFPARRRKLVSHYPMNTGKRQRLHFM